MNLRNEFIRLVSLLNKCVAWENTHVNISLCHVKFGSSSLLMHINAYELNETLLVFIEIFRQINKNFT